MKVSIIGSGNVAHHIGAALKNAGNSIADVTGRNIEATNELAAKLEAKSNFDFAATDRDADLILLCVKDDAIEEVAALLPHSEKIIAHTSGFRSFKVLQQLDANYGVFYPLQTMKKDVALNFNTVPILIEGSNEHTVAQLSLLAGNISESVHVVNEIQRQYIHVAAVFANNFTNHLLELSEQLLLAHNLDFNLLRPLIARSAENIAHHSPAQLQTGPAARKDFFTIEAHLNLLQDEVQMTQIYRVLTESILRGQR